ncbi:aspartate/glutamate racemase family protein [Flavobacterium pallidum]|uniref:Aspartate racemase n=1 Tax=Flavobacterium pallidum TaxID=2172098 RepID=A0A2S1SIU5_9FLAO|nr:aspartate/glutamate racemase family protein [Flavobacterium pallidum]AWI26328.1 aspartate racemase [Flavobacterium pallidum]
MKKIGLVGGISWTSTADYYRLINQETNKNLGGINFAECLIYSVNFEQFASFNAQHDWEATCQLLSAAANHLKDAGADVIMLGANTAHIVAERVAGNVGLPLIDIREATADAVKSSGLRKVGLLGTIYTMELDFYKDKLTEQGIEVIIPESKSDREYIEGTLVNELGKGILQPETRAAYQNIIDSLIQQGAQGIVLGCTEIPLLISQEDVTVPVFNTTLIHVKAAVKFALETANE